MQDADLSNPRAEEPYLSDVLTFYGDIAPNRLLHLYAGVGAGKNSLIEKMMAGCPAEGIPRLTVLLITSRKAKVIEMLSKHPENVFGKICDERNYFDIIAEAPLKLADYQYPMEIDEWDCTIIQRSVICTNAAIEKYLQYCYEPNDPSTHLWNRYDLIVWDEAHSLGIDSSFQSAPYHVMQLFQETYRMMRKAEKGEIDPATGIPRCRNLIMMTGTPEAIAGISMPTETHYLDMRSICRSVSPANVHFLDTRYAQEQIKQQLASGERIVYFANHVPSVDALAKTYGVSREHIAISFSDKDRRSDLKQRCETESPDTENDYTRMVSVEQYLATHSCIRPDIDLFVTTSRNKEGIDINDTDIRHVYVESHCLTDIRQMAGRIRSGAEHLYIITDSKGHSNLESIWESDYDRDMCRKVITDSTGKVRIVYSLDEQLRHFCQQHRVNNLVRNADSPIRAYNDEHPEIGKYIDFIKHKHPYVEYDYFKNSFRYNEYRKHALTVISSEIRTFCAALDSPPLLKKLFQQIFPQAQTHLPVIPKEEVAKIMECCLAEHPDGLISRAERDRLTLEVATALNRHYDPTSGKQPQLNHWLRPIGYQVNQRGNNKNRNTYDVFRIIRLAANTSDAA